MAKKVLIFGGPGPATNIGQAIVHANSIGYNEYEFEGYINDYIEEKEILGYPVVGGYKDIPYLLDKGYYFLHTVLKIGGMPERIEKFEECNIPIDRLATFIHPMSFVMPTVTLEPGVVVMPFATVSANSIVRKCTLVMTNVFIGLTCEIGSYNFLAPQTCLGSWITTGTGVWTGFNSTVRGRTILNDYCSLGAGSVLTKDIPKNELWVGNPAKFHKNVMDRIKF